MRVSTLLTHPPLQIFSLTATTSPNRDYEHSCMVIQVRFWFFQDGMDMVELSLRQFPVR